MMTTGSISSKGPVLLCFFLPDVIFVPYLLYFFLFGDWHSENRGLVSGFGTAANRGEILEVTF